MAKKLTKKGKQEMKKKLIRCRRVYAERGAKLIEVTHLDGKKSAIANPKAVKAAMDAIKVELDRQIDELGVSPKRSAVAAGELNAGCDPGRSGLNEVVRDWMLREHADERKFMDDFSEGVTFLELVKRMRDGENFYEILDCGESQQREYCFAHLSELTGTKYGLWYDLWLAAGPYDNAKDRKDCEKERKRLAKKVNAALKANGYDPEAK